MDVKITIRNNDGTMKSESEINKLLADNGYKNSKITIAKDGKITLDIPEAKTGTRKTTVKVSFVKLDSNAVPSSTVSTTEGSTTETTKAGSTTETTKAGSTTETTKAKNTTETTKPESTTSADNNVVSTDITYTLTSTTPTIIPENGGKIVYNITVTNNGTADAKNIVIRDMIPDGTTFASADNNGAIIVINGKQYITWTLDTLKASDSKIVSFTVKVPQMTTSGTKTFINIAEAQSFGDKNIDISITDGWEKTGEIKHIQNNIITPNTGDNMIIIPFIIIAFVSLAVIFLAFADLKRKQKLS